MGEIIFASLSQYVLIQILPESNSQGSVYGIAMMVQVSGRIMGGVLAFPLVVYNDHAPGIFLWAVLPFLFVIFLARRGLREISHPVLT